MFHKLFIVIVTLIHIVLGAQGSGIFIKANIDQAKIKGDQFYYFKNSNFLGALVGDSIQYISNGKESTIEDPEKDVSIHFRVNKPIEPQGAVRPGITIGYEKSFNKVISLRAAAGWQSIKLDGMMSEYDSDSATWDTVVNYKIVNNYISIPLEGKILLPLRRSGLYITGGAAVAILLSSRFNDLVKDYEEDLADFTSRVLFNLGFKIGAEIALGNIGHLIFESGYSAGLTNTSPFTDTKTRFNNLSLLNAGFRINLPKSK